MKVGEYTCEKGEKVFGKLQVTELADGSAVEVPLILVNGEKEGPTLSHVTGQDPVLQGGDTTR